MTHPDSDDNDLLNVSLPFKALILIVDDDPTSRQVLKASLCKENYATKTATSGHEALELIAQIPFDLVLLDIMMPEMSGLEVLSTLRQSFPPDQLPVVMATGITESSQIVTALNLGANDYIFKPFNIPVALARIRSLLIQKKAEDALRQSQQRYQALVNSIEGIVWEAEIGKPGFSYISPQVERLLGYRRGNWIEQPHFWKSIIHPEDLCAVERGASVLSSGQKRHQLDYRVKASDGKTIWIRDIVTVITEDDRPVKLRGVMLDITDQKEIGLKLQQTNQEQKHRIEGMTSDLASLNYTLHREIEKRIKAEESLQHFPPALVKSHEDEYRRISFEIPDKLGRRLATLSLNLKNMKEHMETGGGAIEQIQHLQNLVSAIKKEMHQLTCELLPPQMEEDGLNSALDGLIERWQERTGIPVNFQSARLDGVRFPHEMEITAYRVVQGALAHIEKNSRATHVNVILDHLQKEIFIDVEDNGIKFDPLWLKEKAGSNENLDLLCMQERILLTGGSLDIKSAPGSGTGFSIKIPWQLSLPTEVSLPQSPITD
jgi:PAS domain S-box-containing protein